MGKNILESTSLKHYVKKCSHPEDVGHKKCSELHLKMFSCQIFNINLIFSSLYNAFNLKILEEGFFSSIL